MQMNTIVIAFRKVGYSPRKLCLTQLGVKKLTDCNFVKIQITIFGLSVSIVFKI